MLTCACPSNDALLSHARRQQDLPDCVVDLVCPGVTKSFQLQKNAEAMFCRETFRFKQRCWPTDIITQQGIELRTKSRIEISRQVQLAEFFHIRPEHFRNESTSEFTVVS